jgi:DDE superfamily endonuclease
MKLIVHILPALVHFTALLALPLSQPQRHNLQIIADALCVAPNRKTLALLQRLCLDAPDPSNLADFLRISPWDERDLRQNLTFFVLQDLLRDHDPTQPLQVFVTFDDCTSPKDKGTRRLQGVDWTFDHTQHKNCKGAVHIAGRVHVGERSYTFSWRPYLRAKTVRRLNRQRPKKRPLLFKSKLELAQEMLEELKPYLPPDADVYVLFDRWYASADLLRFIRRQGWDAICAIKSNRRLNGTRLNLHDQQLWGTRYRRVAVTAADGTSRPYLVRELLGKLKRLRGRVRVIISRRHPRDKRPKYFLSTDITLTAQEILTWYGKRWAQEVDYWFLKQELGLGDFRVQAYEAMTKWYAVVYLVLTFLTWQLYQRQRQGTAWRSLACVLAEIRAWHARDLLQTACEEVLATGDVAGVLQRYLHDPPQGQAG